MVVSRRSFEETVVPHLDAAYNYARWLTHNAAEAEDVVHDAYLRALRYFSTFRDDNARAWLLTIVRNTWFGQSRRHRFQTTDGEEMEMVDPTPGPEAQLLQQQDVHEVREALASLPTDFREVLVLRELESLSYREIANVVGVPIGTVMSRLSRARERLQHVLLDRRQSGGARAVS